VAFEFVKRQPVLGNPPLRLALAQMRFPRLLGLAEADVRPVQRGLAERYPRPSLGRAAEIILTPSGVAAGGGEAEPVFQFRSDDEAWTVTLTPASISLETTAYIDFADFIARWDELLAVVAGELGVARQERIGLRYINELACPAEPAPAEIKDLVRDELVGAVGAHPRTQRLVSSMHEQRFAQESGVCTLRHGLVIKAPEDAAYILDMDFYDDHPRRFDQEAQVRQLADFNHGAFELFRWSVPPTLFASFDPQEPTNG
jgi:uncharacterized protein (TIGR04255 family)